ncbi:MAG: hypothetical protein ACOY3D_03930 [Candidatus Omnitrophota bacterium]
MQRRKRVKVIIGQKPQTRLRQAALILAATLLLLGISDFLGFSSLEERYLRPRKKGTALSASAAKSSRRLTYEDYLRMESKRPKVEAEKQRILNRSLYFTLAGVILFIITILFL